MWKEEKLDDSEKMNAILKDLRLHKPPETLAASTLSQLLSSISPQFKPQQNPQK